MLYHYARRDVYLCVCTLQTHLISDPSPIAHSKAVKNAVEIEGMKQAHVSYHNLGTVWMRPLV